MGYGKPVLVTCYVITSPLDEAIILISQSCPPWSSHRSLFNAALSSANNVCQGILPILKKEIKTIH